MLLNCGENVINPSCVGFMLHLNLPPACWLVMLFQVLLNVRGFEVDFSAYLAEREYPIVAIRLKGSL